MENGELRMENDYKIIELNKDTDDKFWQMRFDFYNLYKKPNESEFADLEEYKQKFLGEIEKDSTYFHCLVFSNKIHTANFSVYVEKIEEVEKIEDKESQIVLTLMNQSQSIDQELWENILDFIKIKIKDQLPLAVNTNFLLDQKMRSIFNLKTKGDVDICILKRENMNYDLLKEWRERAEKQNPDLKLDLVTELPDESIDEFAALFTEFLNDMPKTEIPTIYNVAGNKIRRGQKSNQEAGNIIYRLLAFNKKNRMVGTSNVIIIKKSNKYPYQFMTGVKKELRGQAIGKWFKAVMYPMIFEKHPEVNGIVTEMFPCNKYIQNINSQIGFEKIGERGEYLMSKENFNKKE